MIGSTLAQRRPGREPRRHVIRAPCYLRSILAQRRPGREPRRHLPIDAHNGVALRRSTKAGARTPATLDQAADQVDGSARSTKAGARTPATLVNAGAEVVGQNLAQRRPGREPRRHHQLPGRCNDTSGRSTKAGARTPATPPPRPRPRTRRPRRSTKAGARTPATPTCWVPLDASRSAQRRPGREPRRHRTPAPQGDPVQRRSTKAGARTPATLDQILPVVDRRRRSTKAGARTPATRIRPGQHERGSQRSTKAGARTPATPETGQLIDGDVAAQRRPGREPRRHGGAGRASAGAPRPLNEGRGANPGDTRRARAGPATPATDLPPRRPDLPLNEGRGANPGDTRGPAPRLPRQHPVHRSTKAGARTPATLTLATS